MQASNEIRVANLNRNYPEFLINSVIAIVTLFSRSVNVQLNLTEDQIITISKDLIIDCPDWCIYDFVLFFKSLSMGKYGKIYGAVDESKIFEMKTKYEEERSEAREIISQNQKADLIEAGKTILSNIDKLPVLKELMEEKKRDEVIENSDTSLKSLAYKLKKLKDK